MSWIWLAIPGALALAAALLTVSMLRRRAAEDLHRRLAGRRILRGDRHANFFGVESKGGAQVRGNGILVLTPSFLVFEMLLPRREMIIDLHRVRKLASVRSHLGKSVMRPLLRVEFDDGAGGTDAAAWYVRDVDGWVGSISGVCDCEVEGD
jgi:hypothetical protein